MSVTKYTIFLKFADENHTRTFNCDFYEIEPSIGKITIPDEVNPDKCRSFYIYPGICYIEQIVQHFGYIEEHEELQKKRQHVIAIRNQVSDQVETFEESIKPNDNGGEGLYG